MKRFFGENDLTPDIDCSLLPPEVLGEEAFSLDWYCDEKRRWQSAPCVCKTPDGMLFCAFSGDNYNGDEAPNNYNMILQSADGGVTWQPLNVIDHPDSVRMHEPILWVDGDGTLWHFWAQSYRWWDGRGGVWAMRADRSGKTLRWSEPRRLCDGVMACPPIIHSSGAILLPVSIWKNVKSEYHSIPERENSSIYISTDKGESFVYAGGANAPDTTFDENAVVERDDGNLYMIMRCKNSIAWSVSEDLGKTWSVPEKLMDHTSSRSYLAKFPSGVCLLVTNDSAVARSRMTAFLSFDDCKSWSRGLLLDERESTSYPAGFIDSDGRAFVAYDFNRYREEEIYLASFTEREAAERRVFEAGSCLKRLIRKGGSGGDIEKVFESGEG